MEKLKNLCGQIPEELHNKVRTEQESLGLTLGKYLELHWSVVKKQGCL